MHKKVTFLFFLSALLFANDLSSQNKQIRAYNLEDGLPQSQVYYIIQDNVGYLWLGTQGGGIARFDGDEFEVWNEKNGLLSNYIQTMQFINDSLYIGTKHGLSIKTNERFTNYPSSQINCIIKKGASIFLGTNSGCYTYTPDKKLVKLELNEDIDRSKINAIKFIKDAYWIASESGLWKVDSSFTKKVKLNERNFIDISHHKEKIFCATFNNGLYVFDSDHISNAIVNTTKRINNIKIYDDELWIATDNKGIIIIDTNDYTQKRTLNKQNNLPVLHIRKSIKDRQSNTWLATSGGGILKISENNFIHYGKDSGLLENSVYALHHQNNEILFSNGEEGLMKIDSLGLHPFTEDNGFLDVKVRTLTSDQKGNLFAGTDGKGILVMHQTKKDSIYSFFDEHNFIRIDTIAVEHKFTDTLHVADKFPFNWVKKIHSDKNTIWAASYSSGIVKFDYNVVNRKVENLSYFGSNKGIKDLHINDIITDQKGTLWYGTKNGEIGYIRKGKVNHLGNVIDKNTAIRTLLFHNEELFIATSDSGIWWSNLSDPIKFEKLSGKKQLYSNNIYQLVFDQENQLWAGSENGIDKIILSKNNVIEDVHHFGPNDGFLGIETCLNAVAKDADNNLWFGTINGLTKHEPSNTQRNIEKPELFFENIDVMNVSIPLHELKDLLSNNDTYKLEPNQNLLSFSYRTVDLNNPNEMEYRWKINELDWSNWNKDTKVNIASDYGQHTFYVQSRNLQWLESDVKQFTYKREKPIYMELWFRWLLYTVFGLVILSLVVNYFNRIKKREQKEKERLQLENNLLSLEQKALRLQMNPHFIFNVLNGIKAMGTSDKDAMDHTINTFATLLRETLNNSRKDHITLGQEIKTLKNYIEVEQLMAEKEFDYTINANIELDEEEVLIPPMLIQPFVENGIRHGIMAVKRKGQLTIDFTIKDDFLHCNITDNGIGINQSKKSNQNSSHQSMALEVTKERIEQLSGSNTLTITELVDSKDKIAGTEVRFKIPLLTDY